MLAADAARHSAQIWWQTVEQRYDSSTVERDTAQQRCEPMAMSGAKQLRGPQGQASVAGRSGTEVDTLARRF